MMTKSTLPKNVGTSLSLKKLPQLLLSQCGNEKPLNTWGKNKINL
jgi:hypothetical protein